MKIYESAENYLETILILKNRLGSVRSVDIATEMGFSKPSVSIAMKHFRENNLVSMDASGLITLTDEGREIAQRIYERHTVLQKCLMMIGVSEATAKSDACLIEHDISDETFGIIKRLCSSEKQSPALF